MNTVVNITALLVAPMSALGGVCAGAYLAWRLGKGQSPVPPLPTFGKAKVIEEEMEKPKRLHPPAVRA